MGTLTSGASFSQNLKVGFSHGISSAQSLGKTLTIEHCHPLPRGIILDRPQAHDDGPHPSHLKSSPQSKDSFTSFDFAYSRGAG